MEAEKTTHWKRKWMVKRRAMRRSWPPDLGLNPVHCVEPLLRGGCSKLLCRWKFSLSPAFQEPIREHREDVKLRADLHHFENHEVEKYQSNS
jgi:hypothetical protein